ncbi:MAG: peptide ABC transporter substrate-binding protein [Thermomicrobiales bacterium]|nr:peptide ABC transporter substrate-binding protein [Thermomicrobiales bacterium]
MSNQHVILGDPRDPREIARRLALMEGRIGRRSLVGGALAAAGLMVVGARAGSIAAAPARQDAALPDDAAPLEEQVYVVPCDVTLDKTPDFYEAVYERTSDACSDIFSDPLVRLNRDFEIIPAAATEWSSDESGTIWTFTIDPNLMWNDGTPVTANDWVSTFRYGADPAHAWDFTWYFQGIMKGWDEAIAGEIPLEELGVRADDDHTLVIETVSAAPYLPAMLLYSCPLSAKALVEKGSLYNSNPATSVSSGPLMLETWEPDQRIVFVKNPDYKGTLQVPIQKVVLKLSDPKTWFTMYSNDEVDFMQKPAPAEVQIAQAEFPEQIYSATGDFRTWYLFFDVTKAPFDDIKVRQAFSHVVDRDTIQAQILGPAGRPAYSWLAPGFPAANGEGLKEIQKFDPELAKQLLAEAGYPNGEGFPPQVLWLRNANALDQNVANAIAAAITQQLGIQIEVSNKDQKTFTDALNAKPTEIPFGYVSYGMDFLDPYNMLSVWLSGGRHSWTNAEFDKLVDDAASFLGEPDERTTMFQEAEKILVEDVPGVFVYHETPVQLVKPWVKGAVLEPDKNGITAIHWPFYTAMCTVPAELYIGKDAPVGRGDM